MNANPQILKLKRPVRLPDSHNALLPAILVVVFASSGCSSMLNPATGIPAHRLPAELLGQSRENSKLIDLAKLGQKAPDNYRLAKGDLLGIWIDGVFAEKGQSPQLPPVQVSESGKEPPAIGYPIPVQDSGVISLPLVDAINVDGKTLEEAKQAIVEAYTKQKEVLVPGRERVIVTLMRKRKYHVLVVRQETGTPPVVSTGGTRGGIAGTTNVFGGTKQGSGSALDLPAYQNDLLNVLVETGGLPGLDAVNEIVIQRGVFSGEQAREKFQRQIEPKPGEDTLDQIAQLKAKKTVKIPLRLRPGQEPEFSEEDVILNSGDVVFIDSRFEFFTTGGLLPSGIYPLPRDYDLDVIGAMAMVNGPIANGGFNQNNLTGTIVASGISDITPSMLVILRRRGSGQIPIRIDLNDALRDPRHRVLIQSGDLLVLQQTPGEAMTRYLTGIFDVAFAVARPFTRGNTSGTVTGGAAFP